MTQLLRKRMKLNKSKCEYLSFGDAGPVFFIDGTRVPFKTEVKYLGCNMNNKGDTGKEVRKRIKECMTTLSKLHIFSTTQTTLLREKHRYSTW